MLKWWEGWKTLRLSLLLLFADILYAAVPFHLSDSSWTINKTTVKKSNYSSSFILILKMDAPGSFLTEKSMMQEKYYK